jgi:hypothetical protein
MNLKVVVKEDFFGRWKIKIGLFICLLQLNKYRISNREYKMMKESATLNSEL